MMPPDHDHPHWFQAFSPARLLVTLDNDVVGGQAVLPAHSGITLESLVQSGTGTPIARIVIADGTSVLEKAAELVAKHSGGWPPVGDVVFRGS
jgi:hypothetical protein